MTSQPVEPAFGSLAGHEQLDAPVFLLDGPTRSPRSFHRATPVDDVSVWFYPKLMTVGLRGPPVCFVFQKGAKPMARKSSNTPLQHRQIGAPPSLYRFGGSNDSFVYSGDRLRPTWSPRRGYRLTAEHRRQLCTHLAAHAAVSNMGSAWVYMLAVAPVRVRSWTIGDRKVQSLGRVWGVCSTSDFYCSHLAWDEGSQSYMADRDGWEAEIESRHESLMRLRMNADSMTRDFPTLDEVLAEDRRVMRAQACGYLAGHIADGITAGIGADEALRLYDRRDTQYVGVSDIAVAQGLTDLLPAGEYENAVRLTEAALRRPEVWAVVQRVASELEQLGLIEGDPCEGHAHDHLPEREQDWPPTSGQADLPQQA